MSDSPPIPPRKVAFGADHAGVALKDHLAASLRARGYEVQDLGTVGPGRVDYPDFAHRVARAVAGGAAQMGILVCGTGIGMSIAANRHPGIRCALAHDMTSARLAREHNDANVLALGARMLGEVVALDCLEIFLTTKYEGGRHSDRLAKLTPEHTASERSAA